ncbi:sensor histidine kinase, partial [Streptomyces sp. NPDC004561]
MDSTRQRLTILHPRRSLGTVFALSFACVTAATTLLGGFLTYNAAAQMVRVDQDDVFHGVVGDLRQQVAQRHLSPSDYFSVSPDSDSPRDDLSRRIRTDVQV